MSRRNDNTRFWFYFVCAVICICSVGVALTVASEAYDKCIETNTKAFCVATLEMQTNIYLIGKLFGNN